MNENIRIKGQVRNNGVECPTCESARTPVRSSGTGDTGKRYRLRRCYDCGTRFKTIEVAIPDPVSWYGLCTSQREQARRRTRDRNGWQARPNKYGTTADVDVAVKVKYLKGWSERT